MTRYLFILLFITGTTPISAASIEKNINFKLININNVSSGDEERITEGVHFFNQLIEQHCGFRLKAEIQSANLNTSDAGFHFESIWSPVQIGQLGTYFFRFFQEKIFRLTRENQLQQAENEVSIFVTNKFDMCGFAFPDIQLTDQQNLSKNTNTALNAKIFPRIRNRVIMGAASQSVSDCSYSSRIVAHELAHIFVQDESPHTCWDSENQRYKGCPEDNILATRRLLDPQPRGRWRPPGYTFGDPMEPEFRPAVGTQITPHQCRAILNTVEQMLQRTVVNF